MVYEELEQRVRKLEQQFAALQQVVLPNGTSNSWLGTFGMFANDPGFKEVLELGREIRAQESMLDNDHAGA